MTGIIDNNELERRMDEILSELEQESNDEELALSAYYAVSKKLGHSTFRSYLRTAGTWAHRICAALFIPVSIVAGWLAFNGAHTTETEWTEITVPSGQTRQLTLCDGTRVTLNSGSRLIYPDKFSESFREVFFEGEVYAEVVKNPEKPFTFHNGEVDLQVFGTTFDVKSYSNSDYSEVTLIEGSVRFDIMREGFKRSVDMAPGDLVQYCHSKNSIEVKSVDTEDYRSFAEDQAHYYYNLPLREIAIDLERAFCTKIVILDEELAEEKFLAFFSNGESLDEILHSFSSGGKISVRKINDIIYLQ